MEKRRQPRFTTQFKSSFSTSTTHEEGQGRTLDISRGGCKVQSPIRVTPGMRFECRLYVPGLDWPLRVDEAVVRWADGEVFGMEFVRLRPEEQAKLIQFLTELETELAS